MEKLVRYCDHCGKPVPGTERFWLETDSRMDGAGARDNGGENLDLCPEAQRLVIDRFLELQGRSHALEGQVMTKHEWNKAFIARWKKVRV